MVHDGAVAGPFVVYYNVLDTDLYLRVYLRVAVGTLPQALRGRWGWPSRPARCTRPLPVPCSDQQRFDSSPEVVTRPHRGARGAMPLDVTS